MRYVVFLIGATLSVAGDFTTALGDNYPYLTSSMTTDAAGNTYVVGSRSFGGVPSVIVGVISTTPPTGGGFANLALSGSDVFVSKLDPSGKVLFTDTFAGKGVDTGSAIAVDPAGNIYIAGTTTSPDFPLSKALQKSSSALGTGFIMKLSNDGSTILYSTYFGGTLGATSINSLATDTQGNLYLSGTTTATDFPHTAGLPFGPSLLTNTGVFMTSISAAGDAIRYSGVLVGGPIPIASGTRNPSSPGVAVDSTGNAYFAGNIGSSQLPTTLGVLMPTGGFSGYVAKVNVTGTGFGYLTYTPNFISSIAVDAAGEAFLGGFNFAARPGNPPDGYVAKLNPTGSAIVWMNSLSSLADSVASIALDASGSVWATGSTSSTDFPNKNGWSSGSDFVVDLSADGSKLTYSALYPAGTVATSVAVDVLGAVHLAGSNGFVSVFSAAAAVSKVFGLQNAAGGAITARVSPAEVISIYGPGIGPAMATSAAPTGGFYPKTLAGVQVTINGANIPLLYVSANQINAVVPMGLPTGAGATLRVTNGISVTADYPIWIVPSAPQTFSGVINQDGTLNSDSNPAKFNSVVTFYVTGWQSNFAPLADGQVATVAQNICTGLCLVGVPSDGFPWSSSLLYGGSAPGIVAGVTQFNLNVGAPRGILGANSYSFIVTGTSSVLVQQIWIAP